MIFALLLALLCFTAHAQERVAVPHAQLIRSWNGASLQRGHELYTSICVTCHGTPTQEGTLPTARAFWRDAFLNGDDPLSIYKTLANGLGQMPAWTFLTPDQRYDVIHYIREALIKTNNPSAYFEITEKYLTGLPVGSELLLAPAPKGPPYLEMDFGPAMFWTFQVATNDIAYKGIAVRVDEGPGGVSKGRAWMLYDHDTMRAAAAWTGDKFIDWRGIAFDGSHGTHARIVGERAFVNPAGPGWANPATGTFDDPRLRGRDGKPYGPLPRSWAHYQGAYYHSNRVVISYTVGGASVLESPGYENGAFTRTLQISNITERLQMRIARAGVRCVLSGNARVITNDNFQLLEISPGPDAIVKIAIGGGDPGPPINLVPLTRGGPPRWNPPIATRGKLGTEDGPFAIDELIAPNDPWHTWMRFGGFDFFQDARRAAICTWNGDVWLVSGIEGGLSQLTWKRIASGLFQPLGLKIVNETIHVTCRDQIARLRDLNADEEIDFVENFNNDHQVTEHFHEFAMGLQTDAAGNFYYAKSARHALPAVVPHHGTLLKVSQDGSRTEIIANGFRAANGVCINDDGTFFVTDQEGHWTPKNRINLVRPGGFYGNLFGYHDRASTADSDMEQPLVWITNEMDRSPGELVRVTSAGWGKLNGMLLNLSYGTGRIFAVLQENIGGTIQGGVVQLPIPDSPTGVMRGRFHPQNGHLYACGMYAWAGNRQSDGGFYRIRATGKASWLPIALHARKTHLEIEFSDPLEPASASDPQNYSIKTWSLKRTANYGSKHFDERKLQVSHASLADDQRTVRLAIPDLKPIWSIEIKATLRAPGAEPFTRTIHNTIHALAD